MPEGSHFYDAWYHTVSDNVRTAVRREVFGEDIGQASWLTVDEYRAFFAWLDLHADQHVLDVACGSGGPALFLARMVGCRSPAFRRRPGVCRQVLPLRFGHSGRVHRPRGSGRPEQRHLAILLFVPVSEI
jgi:hypothetical protein